MKFNLAKSERGLVPATDKDKEKLNKVGIGEVFKCSTINQRNYEFLKKYWALVDFILQNLPEIKEEEMLTNHQFSLKTKDDIHFYIKIKNGYVEKKFIGKNGNIGWAPKSISFDKMDEKDFEDYFSKAIDTGAELIGVENDTMLKQLMEFI